MRPAGSPALKGRTPKNPSSICWGCEKLCPAHDLACGNGSERTAHPSEWFGDAWQVSSDPSESSRIMEYPENSTK